VNDYPSITIKEELGIVLGSSLSESVLPRMIAELENLYEAADEHVVQLRTDHSLPESASGR
jgi:hypothetical protein